MGLPTRIGLSFRSKEGSICRTFAGQAMSGIACEADGRWRMEQILSGGRKATDHRKASAADPRLAAAVEDLLAGVPFDAEADWAARDADWRPSSRGNRSGAGFGHGELPLGRAPCRTRISMSV